MTSPNPQRSGIPDSDGTLSGALRKTCSENSLEQNSGEALMHERMAAAAAEAGFPEITASHVHSWTRAGLLPASSNRISLGRAGFRTALRPGVVEQLIVLARLRRLVGRRRHTLAVLLWLDAWEVRTDTLKRALLSVVPPRTLPNSDEMLDRLAEQAPVIAAQLRKGFRAGRRAAQVAEDAAVALASSVVGAYEPDEHAARNLERVSGLERARHDAPAGVAPWLSGRARGAWRFLVRAAPPSRVRRYVTRLSRAEIDRSRDHGRFLARDLPAFARSVEARYGLGFGGLRPIARLDDRHAEIFGIIAVVIDRFPGLSRRLDLLIEGLEPHREGRDVWLAIREAYVNEYPDQARELRRYGMEGLLARGNLRRMAGSAELLDRAAALDDSGAA